jgi:hypothetical protein
MYGARFMNTTKISAAKTLLRGMAWFFFGIAGLAFWFGGGIISIVTRADRFLGEMGGIAVALLCAGLGAISMAAEDRFEQSEGNGPGSSSDALRK